MKKAHLFSRLKHMIFLLFAFTVSSLSAQTLYALKIDRNIRFKAQQITAEYQPYLVMGVDQALEFQSTVAKYLVKKQTIERDDSLSPMAKYKWLKRLSSGETAAMADVQESYRWQEYMRIKPQIQPIPKPLDLGENLIVLE